MRVGQSVSQSTETATDGHRIDAVEAPVCLEIGDGKPRNRVEYLDQNSSETCNTLHRSIRNLLIQTFPSGSGLGEQVV